MRLLKFVILIAGLSPLVAVASENWTCAPEQILIGEWNIEIQSEADARQASTYYMADIAPGQLPFVQTTKIDKQPFDDGFSYTGDNFQIIIYPNREPTRNPFLPVANAVAAYVTYVQFSADAWVEDLEYVCIPEIRQ